MAIHANSKLSYARVHSLGMLAQQELVALREVMLKGPGTNRELDLRIGHGGRSWHPTLHRLEKRGMLEILGSRTCTVSGAHASVYAWSGRHTPLPYQKAKTPRRPEIRKFLAHVRDGEPKPPCYEKVITWLEYRSSV